MLIWGFKTEAAFDVWSLEHLANGIAMAAFARMVAGKFLKLNSGNDAVRKLVEFIIVLLIALFWENVEHYIEAGLLPGVTGERITYWFQGVEHWTNRLIADNIMVLLGWFIYTKQNRIFWATRIFSTMWMIVHIFIFPHSMYLHTLFKPE
ncbi:MAG: hypothetical protein LBF77_04880 [Spirochaetaceae bacterium]|jgi:hypothetical protein|nr:hypothetical protein [Spirochaetaceae bacterium]